jgi:hypothetical protein
MLPTERLDVWLPPDGQNRLEREGGRASVWKGKMGKGSRQNCLLLPPSTDILGDGWRRRSDGGAPDPGAAAADRAGGAGQHQDRGSLEELAECGPSAGGGARCGHPLL